MMKFSMYLHRRVFIMPFLGTFIYVFSYNSHEQHSEYCYYSYFSLTLGKDELPKLCHRPHLSYTEAVLHESMRLASVLPTGVIHATTCDTSIGEFNKDNVVFIIVQLNAGRRAF